MRLLHIELTPSESSLNKVTIKLPEHETASGVLPVDLPFDFEVALPAVLKILEQTEFSAGFFSPSEVSWLRGQELLLEDRGEFSLSPERQQKVGQLLFNSLLKEKDIYAAYIGERRSADEASQGLDIEVKFPGQATVIGAYPWELLHDGTNFLCAGGGRGTLYRYVQCGSKPPKRRAAEGMSVLLVAPRPAFAEALIKEEPAIIRSALNGMRQSDSLLVEELQPPTFAALKNYLNDHSGDAMPHIVHFDGHGTFGRRCPKCLQVISSPDSLRCTEVRNGRACDQLLGRTPQGYLAFEDEQARIQYVGAEEFAKVLGQVALSGDCGTPPRGMSLVVLSACKSALALQGQSVFNGLAQRLINARIPAVVAMQFRIDELAAMDFVRGFYKRIARGDSLVEAMAWGRTTLGEDQWYRPVLYLRWQDNEGGRLFDVTALPSPPPVRMEAEDERGPEVPSAAPGNPNYYLELTREFVSGVGKRETAVDQNSLVADFVTALHRDLRPNSRGHILALQAPAGSGKSLALTRFDFIANRIGASQPLLLCRLDLEGNPIRPGKIASAILEQLTYSALRDPIRYGEAKDILDKTVSAFSAPVRSDKESVPGDDPEVVARQLYGCLVALSTRCTVVLLIDNCHGLDDEALKWLMDSFLLKVRDGTRAIVAVLAAERGLETEDRKLRKWTGVNFYSEISELQIEDLQKLARLRCDGFELTYDEAASFISRVKSSLPPGNAPYIELVVSFLQWHVSLVRGGRR